MCFGYLVLFAIFSSKVMSMIYSKQERISYCSLILVTSFLSDEALAKGCHLDVFCCVCSASVEVCLVVFAQTWRILLHMYGVVLKFLTLP